MHFLIRKPWIPVLLGSLAGDPVTLRADAITVPAAMTAATIVEIFIPEGTIRVETQYDM